MNISHAAIYTNDLERLKDFYCREFGGTANEKYVSKTEDFSSYFLTFESGPSLELMTRSAGLKKSGLEERTGYSHLCFSVGSRTELDALTAHLREAGVPVVSGPRETGDGYYESCILDPDGNRVELTGQA
jgi:lactoylglutathione lyase